MKTCTIDRKMSGTGSIHDIASDLVDREIAFRGAAKYAVVLAAYYGGKGYTTHATEAATCKQCRKVSGYSYRIIDETGAEYTYAYDRLIAR